MIEHQAVTPERLAAVLRVIRDAAYAGAYTPSYEAIAEAVNASRWSTMRCIDELAERRMIQIQSSGMSGSNRVYKIMPSGECTVKPRDRDHDPDAPKRSMHSPAQDGSARLLKAIARYHHKAGRDGWAALL